MASASHTHTVIPAEAGTQVTSRQEKRRLDEAPRETALDTLCSSKRV